MIYLVFKINDGYALTFNQLALTSSTDILFFLKDIFYAAFDFQWSKWVFKTGRANGNQSRAG